MTENLNRKTEKNPKDEEYMGNIWGWKFSLIGLTLILILGGIIVYRHLTLDVPFQLHELQTEEGISSDSTIIKD
ncbi:MAG: hypothetical protein GY751_09130 [Bacteroidetes bacterium]|nr:hypothetical protein [Bacteroidota bacterium]